MSRRCDRLSRRRFLTKRATFFFFLTDLERRISTLDDLPRSRQSTLAARSLKANLESFLRFQSGISLQKQAASGSQSHFTLSFSPCLSQRRCMATVTARQSVSQSLEFAPSRLALCAYAAAAAAIENLDGWIDLASPRLVLLPCLLMERKRLGHQACLVPCPLSRSARPLSMRVSIQLLSVKRAFRF